MARTVRPAGKVKGMLPQDTNDAPGVAPGRREEIFAVAAEIFWGKGYHASSMNDVADAMGLRKASLYHYVLNKETLLYEMSVSSMHHIIDAAVGATSTQPETHLREIISRHCEALLADRSRHATALVELRSLPPEQRQHVTDLRGRYDRLIDEALRAVQKSTGRWPGIPIRQLRLALLGMLNWSVFWFRDGGSDSPKRIAEEFADIFLPPLSS